VGVCYSVDMLKKTPSRKKVSSLGAERKADVINRLKTVRGVTDGILKMVEEDVYCVDVLKQISATRASLDRVARIMLENHFAHCFVDAVKKGDADAAVAELMETLNFHRELV
jgi:DNA-binding FrmR family transcriptional regulator